VPQLAPRPRHTACFQYEDFSLVRGPSSSDIASPGLTTSKTHDAIDAYDAYRPGETGFKICDRRIGKYNLGVAIAPLSA
jgi:hypothetical protein